MPALEMHKCLNRIKMENRPSVKRPITFGSERAAPKVERKNIGGMQPWKGGSAIEFWPSSADGFWPTPGPSTYGRPSRSGGLAWTGEPKWICSSSFVESMNLVLGR
jgi:hypothetical protein